MKLFTSNSPKKEGQTDLESSKTIVIGHQDTLGGLSGGGVVRRNSRSEEVESPVCGTRVVVDVVYMPVRISHLKPRWKIVPSSCRLRYVCWGGIRCGDRSLCRLATPGVTVA